ncbi:MAG: hypothetical protein R2855_04770 [Thermomicrobiales bacterium]
MHGGADTIVIPKDRRRSEIPESAFTAAYAPRAGSRFDSPPLTATAIRLILLAWGAHLPGSVYLGQNMIYTKGIGLVYYIGATGYAFGELAAGRLIARGGADRRASCAS